MEKFKTKNPVFYLRHIRFNGEDAICPNEEGVFHSITALIPERGGAKCRVYTEGGFIEEFADNFKFANEIQKIWDNRKDYGTKFKIDDIGGA